MKLYLITLLLITLIGCREFVQVVQQPGAVATNGGEVNLPENLGRVTTWTGTPGISGFTDGTLAQALFIMPAGLAIDSSGNMFVTDYAASTIRKISPTGIVTTFAGSPYLTGAADGNGSSARFQTPVGIALDSSNNLYVADAINSAIRKITPNGDVTTIAGTAGIASYQDGNGAAAYFNQPFSVAVDSSGNVYVADAANHRIRKISPTGDVTTFAGGSSGHLDANGVAAQFKSPYGLTFDKDGNLWVADTGNHVIRKIAPNGDVTTVAGNPGVSGSADGVGAAAEFNSPSGITITNSGIVYVGELLGHTIRKILPNGNVTTFAGIAGVPGIADGSGTAGEFNGPIALIYNKTTGAIYVADFYNHTIRKIE